MPPRTINAPTRWPRCKLRRYTLAKRVDLAHEIVARSERRRRRSGIESAAHQHVGKGNASGQDLDADFPASRLRDVFLDILQDFGAAQARDDDSTVFDWRTA